LSVYLSAGSGDLDEVASATLTLVQSSNASAGRSEISRPAT